MKDKDSNPAENPPNPDIKAKKVAVIAVHGISDQEPYASAREIANLLINPNPEKEYNSRFNTFKEKFVRFLVKPLSVDENQEYVGLETDIDFTHKRLLKHNQTALYQTICLEGTSDDKSQEVHVYEMFWADLSRLGENFFRIFGELYQILFHLSKIGTQTAELAKETHSQNEFAQNKFLSIASNIWVVTQNFCSYLLSSIIPILNLYLLIAAFSSIPVNIIVKNLPKDITETEYDKYFDIYNLLICVLLALVISFIFAKIFLFREEKHNKKKRHRDNSRVKRESSNILSWLSQFVFGFSSSFIIGFISYLITKNDEIEKINFLKDITREEVASYLVTTAWISILVALLWFALIKRFNKNQPGISFLFAIAGLYFLVILILIPYISDNFLIKSVVLCILFMIFYISYFIFENLREESKISQSNTEENTRKSLITPSGWVIILSIILGFLIVSNYRTNFFLSNEDLGLLTFKKMNDLITTLSLNTIEVIYFGLYIAWFVFTVSYLVSFFCGLLSYVGVVRSRQKLDNQELSNITNDNNGIRELKFFRAFGISIASLILPSFLFLFTTLTLWSTLNNLGSRFINGIKYYQPIVFNGLNWSVYQKGDTTLGLKQYCIDNGKDVSESVDKIPGSDCFLQLISDFSSSSNANLVFICFSIVLIIAIWTLFPAILSDMFPPNADSTNNDSKGLGNWLTNGYTTLVWSFIILIGFSIPVVAIIGYFSVWNDFFIKSQIEPTSSPFLQIPALILTFSAGALIALGSTLRKISLNLRVILDAALDVDNYLRVYPENDNPRARIFARYASLLKYICDRPKDKQYDAIVIVAHSQGTTITADLLRYLKIYESQFTSNFQKYPLEVPKAKSPNVKPAEYKSIIPNIYLFTMGSPIKQLYSFSFPHLYHWVYNQENTQNRNPNPDKLLNVKQWVNAYRSGDYVGRYLWQEPGYIGFKKRWAKVNLNADNYEDSNIYAPQIELALAKIEQKEKKLKNQQLEFKKQLRQKQESEETIQDQQSELELQQKLEELEQQKEILESLDKARKSTNFEFCIGAGGHTHYWDESAPEIAYELDRLIDRARNNISS